MIKKYGPQVILFESAGEILSETTAEETTALTDTLIKKKRKSKKTTLCFQAERMFQSEKVPSSPSSLLSLNDFFHQHKSVLLTGRNNQLVECNEETYQKFYDTWVEKSKAAGFAEPNDTHNNGNACWMYHVINSGTEFPGLKITSEMIMGCQLLLDLEGGENNFPEYQFILLDSQNKASGSKWMVWIYNQLTGEGGKEDTGSIANDDEEQKEERGKNSSNALMRFFVSLEDDMNIIFHSRSNLQIDIEFPNIMVKLMPVSKRRAEKLGSDSIANALDNEGKHTLHAFQEAYKSWIQTK